MSLSRNQWKTIGKAILKIVIKKRLKMLCYTTPQLWLLYLILSELYYNRHEKIVSDEFFDNVCKELVNRGGEVVVKRMEARFSELASDALLSSNTGRAISAVIPDDVKKIATHFLFNAIKGGISKLKI